MSLNALGIGYTGLNAAQQGIEVTAHNLANVNTEGYSRLRVDQVSRVLDPGRYTQTLQVQGTEVVGVNRVGEVFGNESLRSALGSAAGADVRAEIASRAERVLGPLDDNLGVAAGDFWASWEALATRPDDIASREAVLHSADRLAEGFRTASAELARTDVYARARIQVTVANINDLTDRLAGIHARITEVTLRGEAPTDLLDQRDLLLDRLSHLAGVTAAEGEHPPLGVYLGSMPIFGEGGAVPLELAADGVTITVANSSAPVSPGGELGALLEAAIATVPAHQANLDAMALSLRDAVNARHAEGIDLDGFTGGDIFAGSSAADLSLVDGLTSRSLAASASGAALDGAHALAMADIGGEGFDDELAAFAGRLGSDAAAANARSSTADTVLGAAQDRRDSARGVSIDQELTDLMRYQRAYEAAARVMTAADQMLDKLINDTGLVGR